MDRDTLFVRKGGRLKFAGYLEHNSVRVTVQQAKSTRFFLGTSKYAAVPAYAQDILTQFPVKVEVAQATPTEALVTAPRAKTVTPKTAAKNAKKAERAALRKEERSKHV